MEEKKEFTKAEVEVIRFEKNDIITQSGNCTCNTVNTITGSGEGGTGSPFCDADGF